MSTAEILSLISLISFIISGFSLILTIFFWFQFKIPRIIGNLSGRTARKTIEQMRTSNEQSGPKSFRSSAINASRGKITMSGVSTVKEEVSVEEQKTETGLLSENKASEITNQQTQLLDSEKAVDPPVDADATLALLDEAPNPIRRTGGKKLDMLDEVILIHTQEVIG